MKSFKWLAISPATGGLVWCFVVGWKIWVTPVRYLHYSSSEPRFVYLPFAEVSGLGIVPLIVPTLLAGLAMWFAWRQRSLPLGVVTSAVAVFCFITGFSIGAAYLPVAGALFIATLMSLIGGVVARVRRPSNTGCI
jgi:hypothetical protein